MKNTYWRVYVGPSFECGPIFECRLKLIAFIATCISQGFTKFEIEEVKMTKRQYNKLPEHCGL